MRKRRSAFGSRSCAWASGLGCSSNLQRRTAVSGNRNVTAPYDARQPIGCGQLPWGELAAVDIVEGAASDLLALPVQGLDREHSRLSARAGAEREEHIDRARFFMGSSPRNRPMQDRSDIRRAGAHAPLPDIPISIQIAPISGGRILSDGPAERRSERALHATRVGSVKTGHGNQSIGFLPAALKGQQRRAPPFAHFTALTRHPSPPLTDPRLAENVCQRPVVIAAADIDNGTRVFRPTWLTLAAMLKRRGLEGPFPQYLPVKSAHAIAEPALNRVEPTIAEQNPVGASRLHGGNFRHAGLHSRANAESARVTHPMTTQTQFGQLPGRGRSNVET